ncbi:MAG: hypothetical protein FWH24_05295, partial [Oscillospiraceae bacterium]|nr:hypothetical protein [Oscillospiraceae bacterium]
VGIDELKSNINGVFDGISSLSAESIGSSVSGAAESGTELFSDPAGFFNLLLADTIDHLFADYVIRPMVGRYLTNGDITGDRYLKSVNVTDGLDGLKFHGFDYLDLAAASEMNSSFIDKDGDITLTVRYDVAYSFLILPLPFAELSITQSVKTKAWLGGKGERYQP